MGWGPVCRCAGSQYSGDHGGGGGAGAAVEQVLQRLLFNVRHRVLAAAAAAAKCEALVTTAWASPGGGGALQLRQQVGVASRNTCRHSRRLGVGGQRSRPAFCTLCGFAFDV